MKTYDYIKNVRNKLGLTQAAFGKLIWPKLNERMARNRIAKYESSKVGVNVIPPGDTLLKIQEIDKNSQTRRRNRQNPFAGRIKHKSPTRPKERS